VALRGRREDFGSRRRKRSRRRRRRIEFDFHDNEGAGPALENDPFDGQISGQDNGLLRTGDGPPGPGVKVKEPWKGRIT